VLDPPVRLGNAVAPEAAPAGERLPVEEELPAGGPLGFGERVGRRPGRFAGHRRAAARTRGEDEGEPGGTAGRDSRTRRMRWKKTMHDEHEGLEARPVRAPAITYCRRGEKSTPPRAIQRHPAPHAASTP